MTFYLYVIFGILSGAPFCKDKCPTELIQFTRSRDTAVIHLAKGRHVYKVRLSSFMKGKPPHSNVRVWRLEQAKDYKIRLTKVRIGMNDEPREEYGH